MRISQKLIREYNFKFFKDEQIKSIGTRSDYFQSESR
jgi:hypothetical protein